MICCDKRMFACLICMIILRGCTRGDPIHSCGILRFDLSNDYYIILIKLYVFQYTFDKKYKYISLIVSIFSLTGN